MKVIYASPQSCVEERKYIINWVFLDIFGFEAVSFEDIAEAKQKIKIVGSNEHEELVLPDTFFSKASKYWLEEESLPNDSLQWDKDLPVIYGISVEEYEIKKETDIGIDILGSLFFLISRYEEAVEQDRDEHDRFLSISSWQGKHGLLHRAIGNEYIELLWEEMLRIHPNLVRKQREFRILPSHDIDHPSFFWRRENKQNVKSAVKTLITGKVLNAAKQLSQSTFYPKAGWDLDPYDTIDWLMDQSEKNGLKSAFYYIPKQTDEEHDPGMPLNHPHVEDQWKRITARGHEIGVHPGYNTYLNPDSIAEGSNLVRNQLTKLGIKQSVLGGRQHFLRWSSPETAVGWDKAGLDYDSTLGFADHTGFRCGVCYEFPMYDLFQRKVLELRQRPLIVMECTVIDPRYMGLGRGEEALDAMTALKDCCRKYNGDFTVLWHNQRLLLSGERDLYARLLEH